MFGYPTTYDATVPGRDRLGMLARAVDADLRGALADYRSEILSLICQGDRAAAKMRFSGIHRASFLGYPPTGRRIAWHGAAFFEMAEGKLRGIWVLGNTDELRAALEGAP